jgi:hypothetical protein
MMTSKNLSVEAVKTDVLQLIEMLRNVAGLHGSVDYDSRDGRDLRILPVVFNAHYKLQNIQDSFALMISRYILLQTNENPAKNIIACDDSYQFWEALQRALRCKILAFQCLFEAIDTSGNVIPDMSMDDRFENKDLPTWKIQPKRNIQALLDRPPSLGTVMATMLSSFMEQAVSNVGTLASQGLAVMAVLGSQLRAKANELFQAKSVFTGFKTSLTQKFCPMKSNRNDELNPKP